MDLSNKSLALLLVAAIVIALGGTLVSLNRLNELGITGGATSGIGQVNVTIASNASCIVSNNIIFGSARPTADTSISTDFANNIGWDGTLCAGDSNASCTGLIINNTGNTLLNVTYNTSKLGPAFLDSQHTNASFRYMVDNTEGGAGCVGTLGPTTWQTVLNNFTNSSKLCNNLNFLPQPNAIVMEFNMSIVQNITSGAKTTDITITCTQNP